MLAPGLALRREAGICDHLRLYTGSIEPPICDILSRDNYDGTVTEAARISIALLAPLPGCKVKRSLCTLSLSCLSLVIGNMLPHDESRVIVRLERNRMGGSGLLHEVDFRRAYNASRGIGARSGMGSAGRVESRRR
ncbi:hypothetical protein RHSP_82868 [Rhizobium freirei PRF 81]|uniref:Uncharacterized protein n=1 Tax=Rhizobium freirei PRF 81 TaxID=363754 RepID=N6UAG0_9HYPH|nr:hypothetical protein RHSP_82868 [Rhizobium freirei PRF 81]